jgi:hypothetical protein
MHYIVSWLITFYQFQPSTPPKVDYMGRPQGTYSVFKTMKVDSTFSNRSEAVGFYGRGLRMQENDAKNKPPRNVVKHYAVVSSVKLDSAQ